MIMRDLQTILPVTTVKKELLEIVKRIQEMDETIAITKNGSPVGILMPFDRYEGLLETIEILSDPEILKVLKKSKQDFRNRKTISHKEAWKD